MYYTARKAEFQQLIKSVVLTVDDSQKEKRNVTQEYFVLRNWYVPGSTTRIVAVCTWHTL